MEQKSTRIKFRKFEYDSRGCPGLLYGQFGRFRIWTSGMGWFLSFGRCEHGIRSIKDSPYTKKRKIILKKLIK